MWSRRPICEGKTSFLSVHIVILQYIGSTIRYGAPISRVVRYKRSHIAIISRGFILAKKYRDILSPTLAPSTSTVVPSRSSSRKDQLAQYLEEPLCDTPPFEYWKSKNLQWPQLAAMAFDFLAIPAMSSECERVFSSCSKQTTPEVSQLSGEMLWHRECLKNWQHRGAIEIMSCYNAVWIDV